jgi:hypothetical protein
VASRPSPTRSSPRRARAALGIAGLAVVALACASSLAWSARSQTPAVAAPHSSLGPFPAHPQAEELRCASCHATIVDEWAASAHAHAWIDPLYQQELQTKQRPESCHGCHIPTPLELVAPNEKPPPRAAASEAHELGVSCATCHAGPADTILGPYGAPTKAHDSRRSERFELAQSNALCLGCHSTTIGPVIGVGREYVVGGDGPAERTCVGCHMAEVERSMATDSNDEPLPARKGRSHRLLGPWEPEFLARAFEFTARLDADGAHTTVVLANKAGHRLPGLLDRRLEFAFDALDAQGAVLASATLAIDNRAFLAADAVKELVLDARAASVRVRGTHQARRLAAPLLFLERTIEPPPR